MKIFYILLILIGLVLGVVLANVMLKDARLGAYPQSFNYFTSATNASTTVATSTPAKILARNVNRQYAAICNNHASSGPVYLYFLTASTTITSSTTDGMFGYKLNTGYPCYEIDADNLYSGEVWAVYYASTAGTVSTIEK